MTWKKEKDGKPDLTYIPYYPLRSVAAVLDFGADKYGRDNWREGDARSYAAAALRHLHAWCDPDWSDVDQETKESHLAHAAASLLFAIELESKDVSTSSNEAE